MKGQANSVRSIGLDLSRSSESDTVTKCRPARAYMRVIYTPIYVIHVICPRTFYFEYILREYRRIYFTCFCYNNPASLVELFYFSFIGELPKLCVKIRPDI